MYVFARSVIFCNSENMQCMQYSSQADIEVEAVNKVLAYAQGTVCYSSRGGGQKPQSLKNAAKGVQK